MYSSSHGYPNAGPAYSGAPQPNAYMQPGAAPNQPQMMYNPQQYPMAAAPGPFPGAPNMMPGASHPPPMMQNPAMAQMAANGQSKLPYLLLPSLTLSYLPPNFSDLSSSYRSLLSNRPYAASLLTLCLRLCDSFAREARSVTPASLPRIGGRW